MSLVNENQEIDKESSKQFNRIRTESEDSGVVSVQSNEDELSNLTNDEIEDAELCLNLIKKLKNKFSDENLSLKQICKSLNGQIKKDAKVKKTIKNQSKSDEIKNESFKKGKKESKTKQHSKKIDETKLKETKSAKIRCLQDLEKYLSKLERRTITISPKLTDKLVLIPKFGIEQPLEFAQESLSELIKQLDDAKGALIFTQERAQYLNDVKSLIEDANDKNFFSVLIELKNEQKVDSTIKKLKKLNGLIGKKLNSNDKFVNNDAKQNSIKNDQTNCTKKQRSYTFSIENNLDLDQSTLNKSQIKEITKRHSLTNTTSSSGVLQNSTSFGLNSNNRINSNGSLIRLPIGPTEFNGFRLRSTFKKD